MYGLVVYSFLNKEEFPIALIYVVPEKIRKKPCGSTIRPSFPRLGRLLLYT
jgi:hypothetical protein